MIRFWKITPGGNPTILLPEDDVSALSPEQRAACANTLMDPLHLGGEQVGFVRLLPQPADPTAASSASLPRLDMMGGEFCINATRAFALLLAKERFLAPDAPGPLHQALFASPPPDSHSRYWKGQVMVSGADTPVTVAVASHHVGPVYYREAAACLHFPTLPTPEPFDDGMWVLRLPGISHLVIMDEHLPEPGFLDHMCAWLRQRHGLENEEAAGCLWVNHDPQGGLTLSPAVWVRATGSLCLESACGSGTLATALLLHTQTGDATYAVRQRSGQVLRVCFQPNPQGGVDAWTSGPAHMVAEGQTYITL